MVNSFFLILSLFYQLEVLHEIVKLVKMRILEIDNICERQILEDVLMEGLARLSHIYEEEIFGSEYLMVLKVINHVTLPVLPDHVEVDMVGYRRPFEAEEGLAFGKLGPIGPSGEHPLDQGSIVAHGHGIAILVLADVVFGQRQQ